MVRHASIMPEGIISLRKLRIWSNRAFDYCCIIPVSNFYSLNVLAASFGIAGIYLKSKLLFLFSKPSYNHSLALIPLSNALCVYGCKQLKESLAVDSFSCLFLRYSFVTRHNYQLVCVHGCYLLCGNNFENVIVKYKRISGMNHWRILDLSLFIATTDV